MKIGLLINDSGFTNKDLSIPEKGNPGIGGTQFCFVMLLKHLITEGKHEVYCYHHNNNLFPEKAYYRKVFDETEAIGYASKDRIDIFIMKSPTNQAVFEAIDAYQLKTISWAHNYIIGPSLKMHKSCKFIKRIVFVGKQQYDRYIDCDIIDRSTYIYNMYFQDNLLKRKEIIPKTVTYTGSLVKSKGFHILAKEWKSILKEIPEAQLNIIGSGSLYNQNVKLGKYGIASNDYENKFIPFLTDSEGNILPSVHFLGTLGTEKMDVYSETMVGVMNPSAKTETFGISAVEMESFGIPICTKGKNGILDTVIHKKTGLLSRNSYGLRKNVVHLLINENLNKKYGYQGMKFVRKFLPEMIMDDWNKLFQEIYLNQLAEYKKPNNHYLNNMKFLRILNRNFRSKFKLKKWASIVEFESFIYRLIK